jgi:hypothetical protein
MKSPHEIEITLADPSAFSANFLRWCAHELAFPSETPGLARTGGGACMRRHGSRIVEEKRPDRWRVARAAVGAEKKGALRGDAPDEIGKATHCGSPIGSGK